MKKLISVAAMFFITSCGNSVLIPNCTPAPVADAGPDQIIVHGLQLPQSVRIGTPEVAGSTYRWMPAEGLSDPNVAQPIVSGLKRSVQYQLSVMNRCGVAQANVNVDVYEE